MDLVKWAMRRVRYFVEGHWEERLLVQWLTSIMIAVHVGFGFAVLIGGAERFSLPTYKPLLDLVDGQIWVWGVWSLLAGSLAAAPFKWISVAGLWLGMAWMVMWFSLFTVSVMTYPTAAATPVVAYAGFAMIDTALMTARAMERPREG